MDRGLILSKERDAVLQVIQPLSTYISYYRRRGAWTWN